MSPNEPERQYRVARQTLAMHYTLRDRHKRWSLIARSVLLAASVIFCATTFAADSLYQWINISPDAGRLALGVASVAAFAASIILLVVHWDGKAAQHGDAARRWSEAVALFRRHNVEGGNWPQGVLPDLDAAYWDAAKNSVDIPDGSFNELKARYLTKVEMSKLIEKYPACPRPILWLLLTLRGTGRAVRGELSANREGGRDDGGDV